MIKKNSNKEFFEVVLHLVIAAILVYFVPTPVNKTLFVGFYLLIWITKRDYLWLAFFLVITNQPGGLFSGGEKGDLFRLPLYTLVSGVSFAFEEIYLLILFTKVRIKKDYKEKKSAVFYSNELKMLGIYFVVLLVFSVFSGMSFESYRNVWKIVINLTLFYSIFYVLDTEEKLVRFFRIVFPFAIIALLLQFYALVFGHQLITLFKPEVLFTQGIVSRSAKIWSRPIEMSHLLLVCFTGSLYLIAQRKKDLSQVYLVIINAVSFISIFFSGTRSWILAFAFAYLLYFFIMRKRFLRNTVLAGFGVFFVILLFRFSPILESQFSNAWSRFITLKEFAEGDITAGGTVMRFDKRAPRVMKGFWNSSILMGAGFSDLYFEYEDGHVGYHNLLLNVGILGVLLFLIAFYKIFRTVIYMYVKTRAPLIVIACIPLIMLLMLNLSVQTIKYDMRSLLAAFLPAISLAWLNVTYSSIIRHHSKF